MRKGIVISDLHLLSWRSVGEERFEEVSKQLEGVDTLVLNGDIFDFRWALQPHSKSIPWTLDWLSQLTSKFSHLDIHFIPGNHDCLPDFVAGINDIEGIQIKPHHLVLGRNLFLHGDAATYRMDRKGFHRFRAGWEDDKPNHKVKARFYDVADLLKLSELSHHLWFAGDIAVQRVAWHLDKVRPGWVEQIDDCFFGHTHMPFQDVSKHGLRFHNTGSAIRGMKFLPLEFTYED